MYWLVGNHLESKSQAAVLKFKLTPMNPIIWLRNTLRNRFQIGLLGGALQQIRSAAPLRTVRIVSATRLTERVFWRNSALGRSLKPWLSNADISFSIRFENTTGLSQIYNEHLRDAHCPDVLLFVHDDIWLDDSAWLEKVLLALKRFDIVGVAGNTRILPHQPAWLFSKIEDGKFVWDSGHLSGTVGHGQLQKSQHSVYGPTPASCKLLDGAFVAIRSAEIRRSRVFFDEQFNFHFYDMDFCRSAFRAGLSLGTWPVELTHQSPGAFGNPSWQESCARYFEKWKT